MCHACVIDNVKERMLSRRDFFKRGAGLAAAAAAGVVAAPVPANAASVKDVKDLTHTLDEEFPTYFGVPHFFRKQIYNYAEHKVNLFELTVNEHTGTHMDAPLHFSADGWSVDDIPPQQLFAPLCVIDIRQKAVANADAQLTPDDIKRWTAAHGDIPAGACVAMLSGWDAHVAGDKFRNVGDDEKMHFPGFHAEAAAMLLADTDAVGIAVDTLSLDYGVSADFPVHYGWLPHNRWGLECVANLGELPPQGATIVVGAPKHRGGSGGPARVFAMV